MEVHKQPHVVLVTSSGLGHLIPMIELAKSFVLHHNFKSTILAVTSQSSDAETQILKSAIISSVCDIIPIPSPDISTLIPADAAVATRLCVAMREAIPSFRSALSDMPHRPSALIVDIFGTEALSIARDLNIPMLLYVASHAWFLSLFVYSPELDKQIEGQYVEQKEPLKIPGCNPVRPEDVVDPMLDRNDSQYKEYLNKANGLPKSDAVLINTWEEFQHKDLDALRDEGLLGRFLKAPVYAIGPLVRQPETGTGHVVQWLDKQPRESVVYVSFGSGGTMSYEQMREIAWGLELSEARFVWVVRAPIEGVADAAFFTTGCKGSGDDNEIGIWKYLPEGFVSRTKEVGLLVPQWAPQVTILRHPSVGGFLTHCGWGSVLESITSGVPMIAWPLYAEQRMNATLLAEEVGVAVRSKVLPTKAVVGREEIARMVREVMQVDGQNGKSNSVKEKVREVKLNAEKALGGSSYAALSQVAKLIEG